MNGHKNFPSPCQVRKLFPHSLPNSSTSLPFAYTLEVTPSFYKANELRPAKKSSFASLHPPEVVFRPAWFLCPLLPNSFPGYDKGYDYSIDQTLSSPGVGSSFRFPPCGDRHSVDGLFPPWAPIYDVGPIEYMLEPWLFPRLRPTYDTSSSSLSKLGPRYHPLSPFTSRL